MRILLTNDDGLGAPGLDALAKVFEQDHEVWTIAPDREMSGQSHSITLNEGLKLKRYEERRFAVRGTPVDCVVLSLQAIFEQPPDVVISGINRGPNIGTDILYSGTCAAAREASLRGIPSIAASYSSYKGPWYFDQTADFIAANLGQLIEMADNDRFVNVNWPDREGTPKGVKLTKPGKRRYKDEMVCFRSPRGGEYWFLQPASIESSDEEGTDTLAVREGWISISEISLEPAIAPNASIHDTMEWRGI